MDGTRTASPPVILLATTNPGKVREAGPLLEPATSRLGLTVRVLQPGDAEGLSEDRETFAGNAVTKALWAAQRFGLPSLGEDSGLEVDALSGAPGVRSARFSGGGTEENIRLLLERLAGVPRARRTARFRAAAALKAPGGPLFVSEGLTEGVILTEPRGGGGFGYDPVFLSRDLGRSFAEASRGEKNRVSHRARALRALRGYLFEVFGDRDFTTGGAGGGLVPGHARCLADLCAAGVSGELLSHLLAVGRVAREAALLLAENGQDVDPAAAAAAGLLHDVGKGGGVGQEHPGRDGSLPPGVTAHAWVSAEWLRGRGYAGKVTRPVMVHGLDSLSSDRFHPATWEEKVVTLSDKLVEDRFVGLSKRIDGLKRRHPEAADVIECSEPQLRRIEAEVARACGVTPEELGRHLASVLAVEVLPADAGAAEAEAAGVDRSARALYTGLAGPRPGVGGGTRGT